MHSQKLEVTWRLETSFLVFHCNSHTRCAKRTTGFNPFQFDYALGLIITNSMHSSLGHVILCIIFIN